MTEETLPDAELEVLACLWKLGESTARQIREAMQEYRPLAHPSVITLLQRLEAKRLVKRRKGPVGKAFLYVATRPPDKTYRRVVGDLVERVFGNDGMKLVASLFESRPPTAEEVQEMRRLLDEYEAEDGETGGTKGEQS